MVHSSRALSKKQSVINAKLCVCLTSDFCSSGKLAALTMAVLLHWHTQQRSLIGFVIIT